MIRKANINDIDGLLCTLHEVLDVHHKLRPDYFKAESTKFDKNALNELLNSDDNFIYVYELDNKIVGHIFMNIKHLKESNNTYEYSYLYVDDLCVLSSYQNKGIGKKLMDFAVELAKSLNLDSIHLRVWEDNAAESFYNKLGYKVRYKELEMKID